MQVRDLMTEKVFAVNANDKLDLVDDIMSWQNVRHVPVVDDRGTLLGLITHRDLLKAAVSSLAQISQREQREIFAYFKAHEIMQTDILTTTPGTDLRDAAATMMEEKVGCLPVVDGKRLVGIITEADFLSLAWERNAFSSQTAQL